MEIFVFAIHISTVPYKEETSQSKPAEKSSLLQTPSPFGIAWFRPNSILFPFPVILLMPLPSEIVGRIEVETKRNAELYGYFKRQTFRACVFSNSYARHGRTFFDRCGIMTIDNWHPGWSKYTRAISTLPLSKTFNFIAMSTQCVLSCKNSCALKSFRIYN